MLARLKLDIWHDPAFTALTAGEQWTFLMLLTQPNLNRDGHIALTVRRWAGYSTDTTPEQILAWLRGLAEAGFIALDEDMEEIAVLRYRLPHWHAGKAGRHRAPKTPRPYISVHVRRAVRARDNDACVKCGATDDLAFDHIHPFSRGGPGTVDNLQLLCRTCNSRKGSKV